MPLYYFDVRSGAELTTDESGEEFADLAAAQEEARTAVLEIAEYRLRSEKDAVSVEVRDCSGVRLLTVTASVAVVLA